MTKKMKANGSAWIRLTALAACLALAAAFQTGCSGDKGGGESGPVEIKEQAQESGSGAGETAESAQEGMTAESAPAGETAEDVFDQAMAAAAAEDYEKAEALFKKAIELDPEFARPYCGLGTVYRNEARPKEAEEYYLKAIKLDDRYTVAYDNLGLLYYTFARELNLQGDEAAVIHLDDAINAFKKALEIDQNYKAAYYNLGLAYQEKNISEKAVENFNAYIQLAGKDDEMAKDAQERIKTLLVEE